jgi:hypothetical protein
MNPFGMWVPILNESHDGFAFSAEMETTFSFGIANLHFYGQKHLLAV